MKRHRPSIPPSGPTRRLPASRCPGSACSPIRHRSAHGRSSSGPAGQWPDGPRILALTPTVSEGAYLEAVHTVRDAIARGETYQANLTYRLRGRLEAPGARSEQPASRVADPAHEGLPLALFRHLVSRQGGAYPALLEIGGLAVCSASPELFFERAGRSVVCRPMKGTAPRGATAEVDRGAASALRASPKERAENLMIVDMIRNDLGRIAAVGSVEVRELFRVERYPTLFQMTSEVAATSDAPLPELFHALFPCASITGAPKVRTMEILAGLETTPRGVYTGALGFVAPGGDARFSVAIRTAVARTDGAGPGLALEYGTGSGIVWDSVPERELEETRTKALILDLGGRADRLRSVRSTGAERHPAPAAGGLGAWLPEEPAFELLETLLWLPPSDRTSPSAGASGGSQGPSQGAGEPGPEQGLAGHLLQCLPDEEGFVLLGRHLERLARSAAALGFPLDPAQVRRHLVALDGRLAAVEPVAAQRVRLLVDRAGRVRSEAGPLGVSFQGAPVRAVTLAPRPVDGTDPLLGHKTTRRSLYERALAEARATVPDADDVILWNRQGELTETTIANLVVELDGEWLTPTLASGLLPGTFRAELLARGVVREARLPLEVLERATAIAVVSSVRGWLPARLAPGCEHDMPRYGKAG